MRFIQVTDGVINNKKYVAGAIIIPILLTNDKTIMSLSYGNQIFWPIYITQGNLNIKTC